MKYFFSLLLFISIHFVSAQIIQPKYPDVDIHKRAGQIQEFSFPEVDHELEIAKDEEEMATKDVAMRIAVPFKAKIDLKKEAIKTINSKGKNEWLIKLSLPGAYGVGVLFDQFNIPEGAELFVFNENMTSVNGAITSENNNDFNFLHVSPVQGSTVFVLYTEPQNVAFEGILRIETVTHLYRDLFKSVKGFGDSGSCNINVVCDEGNGWEDEVRSIALILNSGGSRICTGALINNTAMDGSQYLLSAKHCMNNNPNFSQWSFIFDYKSESCTPSINGLLGNSVFGSELLATNADTDFALFELSESIPASYDVYLAGWTRSTLLINNTTTIHHPSGDVMKISHDEDPPTLTDYLSTSGGDGNYWRIADWEEGTTEGGSSGSPLFKSGGKIIGQLRGGYASCSNNVNDYYGAFHLSWDLGADSTERLMEWLDPLGTDPSSLDGVDMSAIGIEEEIIESGIALFPNPNKGEFSLNFESSLFVRSIQVIDVSGRVVTSKEFYMEMQGLQDFDFSGLKAGIYYLNMIGENTSFTKAFIVSE